MKLTREERNWILYDVGNSAFVMLISTIIPIYFDALAEGAGLSTVQYFSYWGYTISATTIIVAILGPVLGTISDIGTYRKQFFAAVVFVGAAACFFMGFAAKWYTFIAVFSVAKICHAMSLIFYDAMLGDVARKENYDYVSSSGYGWGYIGSCVPFCISIAIVLFGGKFGIDTMQAVLIAFILNAVWWIAFTIPLLRVYKQRESGLPREHAVSGSFKRLWHTVKSAEEKKPIFMFLLAFFFYIDGVYTIIEMATAYGKSLGLSSAGLLLALLVTQLVAFPSAVYFARLSKKVAAEKIVLLCITAYFFIGVYAMFLDTQREFWILAVCVGLFQGGIQSLSRSYMVKIIPEEEAGEYFGLYDIFGKCASVVGAALVSYVTKATGSVKGGIAIIPTLFFVGAILFIYAVRVKNRAEQ